MADATSTSNGDAKKADIEGKSAIVADPDAIVPPLSEHNITQSDLATAVKVLEAIAALHPKHNKKKRKASGADNNANKNNNKNNNINNDNNAAATSDCLEQYKSTHLRPLRKALAGAFELHKLQLYNGKTESQHYNDQVASRTLKRQKLSESDHQKKYINSTALRRGRMEKLEKLKMDAEEEEREKLKMLVPDGHVDTMAAITAGPGNGSGSSNVMLLEEEKKDCGDGEGVGNGNAEDSATADNSTESKETSPPIQLPKLRSCYVCKVRYRELHHFYDQLCPSCAKLNFEKRHQTTDLTGRVAVITGSRVKIGYQAALKLLRAGATVVATTRFPNLSVTQYRKEPDFAVWSDRLHVYGLDLRDVTGLEAFTRFLKVRYGENGIDMLINNACQTIRRPRGYYTPLVDREQELWKGADDVHKSILGDCADFERIRRKLVLDHNHSHSPSAGQPGQLESDAAQHDVPLIQMGMDVDRDEAVAASSSASSAKNDADSNQLANVSSADKVEVPFETTGVTHSAAMSQMVILPEDVGVSDSVLPPGLSDINGHQLDLRSHNSWLLKMDEVSTPEVMECMFINAIAPFVLNSRLKPLMTTPAGSDRPDRYIINVSAMEGKFYRYKMPNHPHTNMAKAALNMLTRTSSEDLAKKHRIFMNSVDTGWINDENPLERASKTAEVNNFQTPIDEVDAAARILDPIFVGVAMDHATGSDNEKKGKKSKKEYGKFFKDYRESEW